MYMKDKQFQLALHLIFPVLSPPLQRPAQFTTELNTVIHKYLLGLSILKKDKKLERDRDITGLLEVTVQVGFLMEIYASREAFVFSTDLIGSTRRRTIINKLAVIVLQCINNPLFVSLDMFAV